MSWICAIKFIILSNDGASAAGFQCVKAFWWKGLCGFGLPNTSQTETPLCRKAVIVVKIPLIWLSLSSSFTHKLILHSDTWFLTIFVDHAQLYPTLMHTHGGSLIFCTSFWSKNIGSHCNLVKQNKAWVRGRNLFSFQPCFHSIIGSSLSEWRCVDLWLTAALFAFTHKQKSVSSSGTTRFVFLHNSFFLLLLV